MPYFQQESLKIQTQHQDDAHHLEVVVESKWMAHILFLKSGDIQGTAKVALQCFRLSLSYEAMVKTMKDSKYPGVDGLSPADLMRHAVQLYSAFDSSKTTVDNHSDEWLEENNVSKEDDREFLHQVLYGCVRYKELIKPVVSSLYALSSPHILRSDSTLYYILSYLTLIRLVDLTFRGYRLLVSSQAPDKMLPFLVYMFRDKGWKQWCPVQWMRFYDKDYVQNLIHNCELFEADAAVLIGVLERRINFHKISMEQKKALDSNIDSESTKNITTTKPFNLSQKKDKGQGYLKHELVVYVAKPAPKAQFGPTTEETNLEKKRDENKKKSLKKLADANKNAFVPTTLQRPSNLETIRAEVMSIRDKELKFEGIKANPVPKFEASDDIKLNFSAIIREDYLNRKRAEEEDMRRKEFERNLRDSTEFEEWQRKCREEDEAQRKKEIQDRIVEVAAAAEAAREAREKKALDTRKEARVMREESQQSSISREREIAKELKNKCEIHSKVVKDRNLIKHSIDKMTARRKAKAEIVTLERAVAARQIHEMKELERERKVTLIKELHDTKKANLKQHNAFDPRSTVDVGLLSEMSLADLREKLKLVHQEKEDEIKEKKKAVKSTLSRKENIIKQTTDRVLKMRRLRAAQAKARRGENEIQAPQNLITT